MNSHTQIGFADCISAMIHNQPLMAFAQVPSGVTSFWGASLGWPNWMVANTGFEAGRPFPQRMRQVDDLRILANLLERFSEEQLGLMMLEWPRFPGDTQVLAAPNLRSALQFVVESLNRRNAPITAIQHVGAETVVVRVGLHQSLGPFRPLYEIVVLLWLHQIMQTFIGMRQLDRSKFADLVIGASHSGNTLRRLLSVRIVDSGDGAWMAIPKGALKLVAPNFDPVIWQAVEDMVHARNRPDAGDPSAMVAMVEEIVSFTLRKRSRIPQMDEVAAACGQSERSLARNLAGTKFSFRGIVDRVRLQLAHELLEESDIAIGKISEQLGYSDVSAFVRAFRRQSGTTPAHWRRHTRPLTRGRRS